MKKLAFLVLFFLLYGLPVWGRTVLIQQDCDSVFMLSGTAYAVKNLVLSEKEINFALCDDPSNGVVIIPWSEVEAVKKIDGTMVVAPWLIAQKEKAAEDPVVKGVNTLYRLAIISVPLFFLGIGIFLSFAVLVMGIVFLQKIRGHRDERMLRKRIKRALFISLALPIAMTILLVGLSIWFFKQFENQ